MRWLLFVMASLAAAAGAYLVGRRTSAARPSPASMVAPATASILPPPAEKKRRLPRLILLGLLWGIVVLLAWTLWSRNSLSESPPPLPQAAQPPVTPQVTPTLPPGALAYQLIWPIGADSPAIGHGWFGDPDWRQDGYLTNDGVIRGGSELFALASALSPTIEEGDYAVEIEARYDGTGHFPEQPAAYGLMLRNSSVAVWRAGFAAGQLFIEGEPKVSGDMSINLLLARATVRRAWAPGSDWHTYRFAAKSNSYTLLIDGEQVLTADSTLYADGRTTGLWVDNAVIKIRAYRVYKT